MRAFKMAQPQSLEQALLAASKTEGPFSWIAGGTDLLDEIKNGTASPDIVMDLGTIPGLAGTRLEDGKMHIGAMTRLVDVVENARIHEAFPALHQAAFSVGSPQLRNTGTVGGNLCQRPRCWYYRDPEVTCRKKGGARCFAFRGRNRYHAILGGGPCYIVHPSDLAPALIVLDAEVQIISPEGETSLPLEDFFVLPRKDVRRENILEKNQIVKDIRIPFPPDETPKSAYVKLTERNAWDFAVVSAAVSRKGEGSGPGVLRIALGGVAPVPWRLKTAEDMLQGKPITDDLVRQAVEEALKEARPLKENGYKRDLVHAAVADAVAKIL
ncbi:MAG: FAD binding domain-containing protein [Candidatus Aminicenantales bacterium]